MGNVCCNPFLGPHIKNNKIQKKFKKYIIKKYNSEKKCQSALKMLKNWLRMFKNQKFIFDSISLTDESPVDKENSICGRKMQKSEVYGLNEILLKV